MKNVYFYIFSALFLLVAGVSTVSAGTGIIGGDPSAGLLGLTFTNIIGFIQSTLIPFILGIGFLVFVWGMFQYFIIGGANDEAKEKGKSLVIYSIAGFVLILAFWGIVAVIANGIGTGTTGIPAPKIDIT